MIKIRYCRDSVCMGDDAGRGHYDIELNDDATMTDLFGCLLHGGNGNDWPIAYTGADSEWLIESDIGDLGNINTDSNGEWYYIYSFSPDTLLKDLCIEWVYCRH